MYVGKRFSWKECLLSQFKVTFMLCFFCYCVLWNGTDWNDDDHGDDDGELKREPKQKDKRGHFNDDCELVLYLTM